MKPVNIATKMLATCFTITCLTNTVGALDMPGGFPGGLPTGGSVQMPGSMPMGGAPGQQIAPGQMPGGMPAPSQADIEDAFAKVEEIQKNDPALFQQLENAGKEIIKELAKQDPAQLEEFAKSFGLKPEELLREAEKPSTPEPAAPAAAIEPEEEGPTIEEEAEEPSRPTRPGRVEPTRQDQEIPSGKKPIPVDEGRVRRAIAQVAERIESLRTKMASSESVAGEFGSLELDLLSLALLITIIDSPEHTARLASGEYDELIKTIETLAAVLVAQEQLIQAFRASQTYYDLLGVSPQVTQKQLDKVFKELKKKLDPAVVEKRLKKSGLKGDDLKRQLKAAKITFSEVEEAYDLISDPITRRDIVDRAIELEAKQQGIDLTTSKAAINEIREALGEAFYKNEIISKIEEYLAKYAPEELQQKKAREKEEKKRLEEQKKRAKQSPIRTPGESFEPTINVPSPMTSGYSSGYPTSTWTPESPTQRYQPSYPDYSAPSQQTPQRPEDVTKDKRDDTKKTEPETAGEKEAKKIDIRSPKDIVNSLDKKLKEFSKAYDDAATQKMVKKLFEEETPELGKIQRELSEVGKKTAELAEKKEGETEPEKKESEKKEPETKTEPEKKGPEKTESETKTEPEKPAQEKVLSKTEEEALFKKEQTIGADFTSKIEQFNTSVDKLRTDLKIDEFHKELDTLARVVTKLRARDPNDTEALAWDKFKDNYEKSETPPAPKADTKKPDAETKAPKVKPSPREKLNLLSKSIKNSIKTAALDPATVSALTDLNKRIGKDIPELMKKADRWFARIPTVERKASETAKKPTTTTGTGSTGTGEKK